jgi:DNA-binding NarL/FixJ family response regulator
MEPLVARAVGLAPSVLVLDGGLSASDLRAVALGIEMEAAREARMAILVMGLAQPRLEDFVALASGISGYLPADSDAEVIADTVNALDSGAVLLPRGTRLPVVTDSRRGGRGITVDRLHGQPVELTRREWEVLVLVRQAYSTAEIARRLVVAPVTVRTHVAALLHKLDVRSRAALAAPQISHQRCRAGTA